jgi:predicted dehydrogenase
MKRYTAAIIGAGSIGALKPDKYDSPKTKEVLTHAHAYWMQRKRVQLTHIIDANIDKAKTASKKWETNWGDNLSSIPQGIDIISICTPDNTHKQMVEQCLLIQPKLIILEKPGGKDLKECQSIRSMCLQNKIPLMIDYSRRYEISTKIVKEDVDNNRLGEIYSCVVYYDRGLLRDGSHAIDLLNYWFGPFLNGFILPGKKHEDWDNIDTTVPVWLSYEKCNNVFLIPSDGRSFSTFDIIITTEAGQISYKEHGTKMHFTSVVPEPIYGDYKTLAPEALKLKTELTISLQLMIENGLNFLDGREMLICTGKDAVKVHEVIQFLRGQ